MKKLLFIALLAFGMTSMSQAQVVNYIATNSGSDTWDLGMATSGTPGATYELGILPNQTRTGTISGFAFPFFFKCQNNNSCGTSEVVPTTTTGVLININTCSSPTVLKYRLEEVIPFLVYEFEIKFG